MFLILVWFCTDMFLGSAWTCFLSLLPLGVVLPAPSTPSPRYLPSPSWKEAKNRVAQSNQTNVYISHQSNHEKLIPHAHAAMICTIHESCYMTTVDPTSRPCCSTPPMTSDPSPLSQVMALVPTQNILASQAKAGQALSSIRSVPSPDPSYLSSALCCTC